MTALPPDPGRVATLLPGRGYSPDAPLLYYAAMLLVERGWTVREVWWDEGRRTSVEAARDQARRELDAVSAPLHLVVAKSLGTFAMPDAVERGLPGVWLTPILTDQRIAAAVRALTARSLLVGGTADPNWDRAAVLGSEAGVLEVVGADHGFTFGSSVDRSLDALRVVTERIGVFLDGLAPDFVDAS